MHSRSGNKNGVSRAISKKKTALPAVEHESVGSLTLPVSEWAKVTRISLAHTEPVDEYWWFDIYCGNVVYQTKLCRKLFATAVDASNAIGSDINDINGGF